MAVTLLLVPLAQGAKATVSATGVVAGSGTDYTITVNNTGDEAIICMQFFPNGVSVVEAFGPAGATARTFGGGFGSTGFVLTRGGSLTFRFTTDKPIAANAGGKLHVSGDCAVDVVVDAVGPAPPPACKCLTLTARILPASIKFTNPGELGIMSLEFDVHWTMNCTTGSGGCRGTLDLVPPQKANTNKRMPNGYKTYFKDPTTRKKGGTHVDCTGDCAKLTEGTQHFVLIGNRGLGWDRRATRVPSIPIVIKRTCQGAAVRPITLTLAFNKSTKLVDKQKSKLR